MKTFDGLILVNYCYPDCIPLKNIMRLPQKEAFPLDSSFTELHPETKITWWYTDISADNLDVELKSYDYYDLINDKRTETFRTSRLIAKNSIKI